MTSRRLRDGLDDEMRDHIERETQDQIDRGVPPAAARLAAHRAFGSVALAREEARAVWVPVWVDQARQDVRYTLRSLARTPVFAVTSILSLAIGIAAAAIVFSVADNLLLEPAPGVRGASQVVDIARTTNGSGFGTMSYPAFAFLRDHARSLASVAATTMDPIPVSLSDGGFSERVYARTVSSSYFDTLGVRAAAGRLFSAPDDQPSQPAPVVVLTHRFWRQRLDADPRIAGRTLTINRIVFTVIGVAEPEFENTTFVGTDLWIPIAMAPQVRAGAPADLLRDPRRTWHMATARLEPGVSIQAAQAELNTLFDAFKTDTPDVPRSHGIVVVRSGRIPAPARVAFGALLALLFAMAATLLAIACSNVGGVLLARASARRREFATRLAIGATGGRLLRQLLLETAVLFVLAALAAVPLTIWFVGALQAFLPELAIPLHPALHITPRTLLFTGGVSLLASIVFGLAPARHGLRAAPASALHGQTATVAPRSIRMRRLLVTAQVALSMTSIVTAGLLVRTLQAATSADIGFRTANVLIASLGTPDSSSADLQSSDRGRSAAVASADDVLTRLASLPGVVAVGVGHTIPLQGGRFSLGRVVSTDGVDAGGSRVEVGGWDIVSPDYFKAVGLPIVGGRAFTGVDRPDGRLVAVVNEAFARVAWPGADAVGRQFSYATGANAEPIPLEVVGVVGNVRHRTVGEAAQPFVYVPFAQHPRDSLEVFVRHTPGQAPAREVRATLAAAAPALPLVSLQSFEDAVAVGLMPQRVAAYVAVGAGLIGLFMAALGLHGVTRFVTAQRTRELAIRRALGATDIDVWRLVIGEAGRLAASGVVLGGIAAVLVGIAAERQGLLFGVRPADPITLAGVGLLMATVVLIAATGPAWRAIATPAAAALRSD